MSTPEVKCVMDEHGRITYQVTEEGVFLNKWEKEMIVSEFDRLRADNAKLIEFASQMYRSILLVPDDHIPAETKARYFEVAVSLGLDVPDD